jgi:NAD(P)-dependent dehydrogenase (short-subunit alcohol dehydrogenase family)
VNVTGKNATLTGSITGSTRNIAVVALTKNLADELGPQGVTVACVHPGLTDTDEKAAVVAAVITFLCSTRAALMNGAVIPLDGGHPGPIWA